MPLTNVFTGASGTLTLLQSGLPPEAADTSAILETYNAINEVGRVTGVEVYVQTDLEEFHEIGRRHPTSLHYGNIHISGRVERAYINGALLFLLLGRGANPEFVAEPYVQPTFEMILILQDPAVPTNRANLIVSGVKFQNWSYRLPEDDVVMENLTFKGLQIRVQDEDEGTVQVPEFPESEAAAP